MTNFSVDLDKAIKNMKGDVDKTIRGSWLSFAGRVIKSTPVAAPELWKNPDPSYVGGTLRGGWNVSIGAPDFSKDGSVDKSGQGTIRKASNAVKAYTVGRPLYLTNPYHYAYPIELGWSSQSAPGDMVRRHVMAFQSLLDREAAK